MKRALGLLLSLAAFGLATLLWLEVSSFGFPDGAKTDYERAIATPLMTVAVAAVVLGLQLLFHVLARTRATMARSTMRLLVAATLLSALAAIALLGLPWYYGDYLHLDHGAGG